MHVAVLQWAGLVVVHLLVADGDLFVVRNGRDRRAFLRDDGREAVDFFDGPSLERSRGVLRQVERLEHELAHLALARAAVIARARQKQLTPGPRDTDVEEPALLLHVELAGRDR